MRLTGAAALLVAALITFSCGGVTDPSSNKTETFNGTITARGGQSQSFTFSVANTGEFTVKVTSMIPTYSSVFGVYYGQGSSSGCQPFAGGINPSVTVNAPALSGQIFKGDYCVVVYDSIGAFPTTGETFTMTVSHP
ncbi:MAG TPA: hypothetical protein VIW45_08720 [Vicinamibacterales bacterium]|jgi:hypothetical protein